MKLKEYLYENRMTMSQLAKALGYNRSHLSRAVKGDVSDRLAYMIYKFTNGKVDLKKKIE